MTLRGALDEVLNGQVRGWALLPQDPFFPVVLDVFIDDKHLTTVKSDMFRPDLRAEGIGSGYHAFEVDLPKALCDGKEHQVSVRISDTREELPNSPQRLTLGEQPELPPADSLASQVLQVNRSLGPFLEGLRADGKLAVIASFQPQPRMLGYHRLLARGLAKLGFKVIWVQNVEDETQVAPFAEPEIDLHVLRRNVGFDFSAWLTALDLLGDDVKSLTQLVLANDSVFGPLCDLGTVFSKMSTREADFWGITESWDRAYHLQSYFVMLEKSAIASLAFAQFRADYRHPSRKSNVIDLGEIGLTQTLLAGGLRSSVLCPYPEVATAWLSTLPSRLERLWRWTEVEQLRHLSAKAAETYLFDDYPGAELRNYLSVASRIRRSIPLNPMHPFWDTLIEKFGCPFIKRELLFSNPTGTPNIEDAPAVVGRVSDYPWALIEEARNLGKVRLAPPATAESSGAKA